MKPTSPHPRAVPRSHPRHPCRPRHRLGQHLRSADQRSPLRRQHRIHQLAGHHRRRPGQHRGQLSGHHPGRQGFHPPDRLGHASIPSRRQQPVPHRPLQRREPPSSKTSATVPRASTAGMPSGHPARTAAGSATAPTGTSSVRLRRLRIIPFFQLARGGILSRGWTTRSTSPSPSRATETTSTSRPATPTTAPTTPQVRHRSRCST